MAEKQWLRKKEKGVVEQDNRLIEASYTLSLNEKRLVLLAISEAKKANFDEITLTPNTFHEEFGRTSDHSYRDLRKATERLYNRTIYNLEGHKNRKTRWVYDCKFDEKRGLVKLSFAPSLRPYLLNLKARFTQYHLSEVRSLASSYSIRLYELLMQFKSTGELYIGLEKFRLEMGIKDGQYKAYSDLRKWVLERAVKEINAQTPYIVKMGDKRAKRKVHTLMFFFERDEQLDLFKQEK